MARILRECGFVTDVRKTIMTARGQVEIDVYAQEVRHGRTFTVLCECKQWKARVPKAVVHSFRSAVMDSGANVGYIITSRGFQSGAFAASEYTNVRLLTWEGFQEEMEGEWVESYFKPALKKHVAEPLELLDRFMGLTREAPAWFYGHPLPAGMLPVPEDILSQIEVLLAKHYSFLKTASYFVPDLRSTQHLIGTEPPPPPSPPISSLGLSYTHALPETILNALSYRELLKHMTIYSKECLNDFRKLDDRRRMW